MLHDDQDWVRHYRPASKTIWLGRGEGYFHDRIILDDLRQPIEPNPKGINFGIIGFASDEGVVRNYGRPGARKGPDAFREAFGKLPVHVPDHWKFYDMGDIVCDDGDLEGAQDALSKTVSTLVEQHVFPIVIGGGHEVSWGTYRGLAVSNPQAVLSILNFDSHFDLRPLVDKKGNSGTSFTQISRYCHQQQKPFFYSCVGIQPLANSLSLFEEAKKLGVRYKAADDLAEMAPFLDISVQAADGLYLTICLDVFAAPYAPGVSAPQPMGLIPHQVTPLIKYLARSGRVVGLDIAELCPEFDRDRQTALLAANLVSTFIHEITSDQYVDGPWTCCS